jgi:peptidoglycan hydrolase-like protein with peptidoglycan-binding domain
LTERDLASRDLWAESLERSYERRLKDGSWRAAVPASEVLPRERRDLTDPEVWHRSAWRARARRQAAEQSLELSVPGPRGLTLAALLAVAGGPVLGLSAALSHPPAADARPGKPQSRGAGVAALQRALGVSADGVFGPQTEHALRQYQRNHGLTVDGIAGPQTRGSMGLGAGPVLKRTGHVGARRPRASRARGGGGGVKALQSAVGVTADGAFGPQTEGAVRRYQSSHGLTVDGVVGPQTRHSLGLGGGPVLKRKGNGSSTGNATARLIQRVISAGNRIATKPYIYGGGHGSFAAAGYDCSGSVSYALHGGGLLGRPEDSSEFMSYGRPGPGRHITIYANPGHVYMTVNGRRFDTSAQRIAGSRWTGQARSSSGYAVRHPSGL